LLKAGGVEFNGARQQGLDEADESVIVALAATLHDVGHVVHRDSHAYYSIPLAADILERILPEFYDVGDTVRMKGEILHAILCHHTAETPLTTEAGVIRVADALDMESGRPGFPTSTAAAVSTPSRVRRSSASRSSPATPRPSWSRSR